MQLRNFSKFKIIHTPGKNLSVADMLSRSFTKAELLISQVMMKIKYTPESQNMTLPFQQTQHYKKTFLLSKNPHLMIHKKLLLQ